MPFVVATDEARALVVVTATGVVDAHLTRQMVTEARAVAIPRGLNVLYDLREAVRGELQNTDLFWIPRDLPALAAPQARRARVAVLHLADQRELMRFWETAYTNLGFAARAFEDEAEAHAWLAEIPRRP